MKRNMEKILAKNYDLRKGKLQPHNLNYIPKWAFSIGE